MSIEKALEQLVINTGRIADALELSNQDVVDAVKRVDEEVGPGKDAVVMEKAVKEKPKKPAAKKKAAPPPPKKETQPVDEPVEQETEVYTLDEMSVFLQEEYTRIRDAQPIKEVMKREPFSGISLADIDEALYPRLLREVRALPSAA